MKQRVEPVAKAWQSHNKGKVVSSRKDFVGKQWKKPVYVFSFFVFLTLLVRVALFILKKGNQLDLYFLQLDDFLADFINPVRYSVLRNPYFDETIHPMHHNQAPIFYMLCWAAGKIAEAKDEVHVAWIGDLWGNRFLLLLTFFYLMVCVLIMINSLKCLASRFNTDRIIIFPIMVSTIMLYSIERANHIIIAAACINYFVSFYDSPDCRKRILGCLCLALAAVLKIYPVFFGFLYFEKRQYREIALSAAMAVVVFFAPFFFFRHGIGNFPRLLQNWLGFSSGFSVLTPRDFLVGSCRFLGMAALILSLFQKRLFDRLTCITFSVLFLSPVPSYYITLYYFPLIVLLFNSSSAPCNTEQGELDERLSIGIFKRCFFTVFFALLLMPLQLAKVFNPSFPNNRELYLSSKEYVFIIVFCAVLVTTLLDYRRFLGSRAQ